MPIKNIFDAGQPPYKRWRVVRKVFPEGARYLMQQLRKDGNGKYFYLTQRIYVNKNVAVHALHVMRETGKFLTQK